MFRRDRPLGQGLDAVADDEGRGGPRAAVTAEQLAAWIEPELALHGYELFDTEVLHGGGRLTLRLCIDKPGGVTLDDCVAADRAVTQLLEAEAGQALPGRYVVEVSSPGIFRRLAKPAHFQRHVGEVVKVVARAEDGGTLQLRGRLAAADQAGIDVEVEEAQTRRVEYAAIARANLDPDLVIGRIAKRRRERRGGAR
jgi:ribosome maturation factor RimP